MSVSPRRAGLKAMRAVTALLLLACIAGTVHVLEQRPAGPATPAPDPERRAKGQALFTSTLRQFDGSRVALAPLEGRPLIAYFWATWCAACRIEAQSLVALR